MNRGRPDERKRSDSCAKRSRGSSRRRGKGGGAEAAFLRLSGQETRARPRPSTLGRPLPGRQEERGSACRSRGSAATYRSGFPSAAPGPRERRRGPRSASGQEPTPAPSAAAPRRPPGSSRQRLPPRPASVRRTRPPSCVLGRCAPALLSPVSRESDCANALSRVWEGAADLSQRSIPPTRNSGCSWVLVAPCQVLDLGAGMGFACAGLQGAYPERPSGRGWLWTPAPRPCLATPFHTRGSREAELGAGPGQRHRDRGSLQRCGESARSPRRRAGWREAEPETSSVGESGGAAGPSGGHARDRGRA